MKRKFIKDISANSLQVIINQVCGLIIFYILSAWLSKKRIFSLVQKSFFEVFYKWKWHQSNPLFVVNKQLQYNVV